MELGTLPTVKIYLKKTIWQQLHALKMMNYFPCFRYRLVFHVSLIYLYSIISGTDDYLGRGFMLSYQKKNVKKTVRRDKKGMTFEMVENNNT